MTHRGNNEFLHPEHLTELSALFDQACAALAIPAGSEAHEHERTRLACILFQLYSLRQLGPDQVSHVAQRLLRQPSGSVSDCKSPSTGPPLQVTRLALGKEDA